MGQVTHGPDPVIGQVLMRFYTFACHSNVRLGKVSLVFLMSEIVEHAYSRIFQLFIYKSSAMNKNMVVLWSKNNILICISYIHICIYFSSVWTSKLLQGPSPTSTMLRNISGPFLCQFCPRIQKNMDATLNQRFPIVSNIK